MKTKLFFGLIFGSLVGCAPMTFSNEPVIDFEQYRSVSVSVDAPETREVPNTATYARRYLRDQLQLSSGFSSVTIDSSENTDVNIVVNVSTFPRFENDRLEYDARATFSTRTSRGVFLDEGLIEDSGYDATESIEDVLDEIALRYTKPYRL